MSRTEVGRRTIPATKLFEVKLQNAKQETILKLQKIMVIPLTKKKLFTIQICVFPWRRVLFAASVPYVELSVPLSRSLAAFCSKLLANFRLGSLVVSVPTDLLRSAATQQNGGFLSTLLDRLRKLKNYKTDIV